ncbi:MAG TPA: peptidoglycan-binding domain-containing protein [Xanthobacteraceae bacterium]|nr:peptidoglycan-binding domain-containing protein [Xanthobacteraceae bacterium]
MRNRRDAERSFRARAAGAGGALVRRLWVRASRRPVDSLAILGAAAASAIIIVNALFLQSGSRPAPFVANPKASQVASIDERWPASPMASSHSAATAATPQPVALRRDDPIADLIRPSPRIVAVQRALSDFGYGQIEPSGILDESTIAAVEKFERERKLPVTGEVSDRLVGALSVMVGHPLQ